MGIPHAPPAAPHTPGKKMKTLTALACLLTLTAAALAGHKTLTPDTITLGDWDFVPTMDGQRVESFLALMDPALAIGDNITAVWFRRFDDDTWHAMAWGGQDNLAAIAFVKAELGLPDSSDILWPDPDAQQGVDTALALAPDDFAKGVFAVDSFAPVIEATPEPGPIIGTLSSLGWAAANLIVQTVPTGCTQSEIMTKLAAMVELDLGTAQGGALAATFAVPTGQCSLWRSLAATLGPSGTWTVPDLTEYLDATTDVDPADAWQSVAPGTVYAGQQTILIEAGGLDANDDPYTAVKLVIAIEDITPPDLSVQLLADTLPALVGPGGLDYALAGSTIWAETLATDNVDGTITTVSISVDCEAAPGPVTLAGVGYHTLTATATDAAGNEARQTILFEIRDAFNHEAAAVIASLTVTPGSPDDTVDAVVLLAAEAFDARYINLATFQLWLRDADGNRIGEPLGLAPGWLSGSNYNPALVTMNNGIWSLAVHGSVPAGALNDPGTTFAITASGLHGDPDAFDLLTPKAPFAQSPDPQAAILALVTPSGNGPTPSPPPTPACRWKFQFVMDPLDFEDRFSSDSCGHADLNMEATGRRINGAAGAGDWCYSDPAHADSDGVTSGGTFSVFLEPRNCCQDCSISIIARPRFTASAEVQGGGTKRAAAAGLISIATPCGNTSASGGVAVGDYSGSSVTVPVGGQQVQIPVDPADSADETFQGNLSCVRDACSVDVSVVTGAYIAVSADMGFFSWSFAQADGRIFRSSLGMTITPQANGTCQVDNDGVPINIEDCNDEVQSP